MALLQNRPNNASRMIELPFPCQSALWESGTMEEWDRWAGMGRQSTLSSVAEEALDTMDASVSNVDTFQASLVLSHLFLTRRKTNDLESTLQQFITTLGETANSRGSTSLVFSRMLFTYHALLAARNTPLLSLLTVSGESWLYNRKLPQKSEFRAAKDKLRAWAPDTEAARKAVWHAVRVLEFAFIHPEASNSTALLQPSTTMNNPLSMLHANWALYTSALICWAYGFNSPASNLHQTPQPPPYPSPQQHLPPLSAHSYITTFISLSPTWQELSHASIPAHVRCHTGPVLEFVRQTRLGEGRMGGLLNEGERVLDRLCGTGNREVLEF